jgi:hypothetical protein
MNGGRVIGCTFFILILGSILCPVCGEENTTPPGILTFSDPTGEDGSHTLKTPGSFENSTCNTTPNESEGMNRKSLLMQRVAAADALSALENAADKEYYIQTASGVKSASIICKFCVPEYPDDKKTNSSSWY